MTNVIPMLSIKQPTPTPAPQEGASQTASAPASDKPPMTADRMVELYVQLRDKIKEIKARHTEELSKYNHALAQLEAKMLDTLNQAGVESMRAKHGTFYKLKSSSVAVTSWSKLLDWIRGNEAWEVLEARANKTAVQAILDEQGKLPPGVQITTMIDVGVRRGS